MQSIVGDLLTFENTKGLALDGMLFRAADSTTTVVHVHGSFGNFYHSRYLRTMARIYTKSQINLFAFNLSAHDGIAEGYRHGDEFEYVGGAVTEFSECVADIRAATTLAAGLTQRVVLQGHSLGCDRVLHYMLTTGHSLDFILLCPCDSYSLQEHWIAPETVEEQIARLRAAPTSSETFDWLPAKEYGICEDDWTYQLSITRKALLSIIDGPPFRLIRPTSESPPPFFIDACALIYLGGEDSLVTVPTNQMFVYFEERVRSVHRLQVQHGDHMLAGCEEDVAGQIVRWIHGQA